MDGGLESRCVGRVYGVDGTVHGKQPSCDSRLLYSLNF